MKNTIALESYSPSQFSAFCLLAALAFFACCFGGALSAILEGTPQ